MKRIISAVLVVVILALALAGCAKKDENTLVVAATSAPHAEILEQCKSAMEAKGYKLSIKVVSDYVTPNTFTEDGEVDANFFQHVPYLDQFNSENKTHLVPVAKVHYEPLGVYKGTGESLTSIPNGAKIAVPNDATNEARALLLLQANGVITLKENAGLTATKNDIVENPYGVEIVELEAALIPSMLSEVAFAVINGNYALEAKLDVNTALAIEEKDSEAAQLYANVLVVKKGNEENALVKALVEILHSEEITSFINEKYGNSVVPIQ